MISLQALKQRFEIIGNSTGLNRALEKAIQVAPTDISLLVTGESGVGKEVIPKIAHQLSHRKHSSLLQLIVVQFQREPSIVSSLVMKREHLLVLLKLGQDILR